MKLQCMLKAAGLIAATYYAFKYFNKDNSKVLKPGTSTKVEQAKEEISVGHMKYRTTLRTTNQHHIA